MAEKKLASFLIAYFMIILSRKKYAAVNMIHFIGKNMFSFLYLGNLYMCINWDSIRHYWLNLNGLNQNIPV